MSGNEWGTNFLFETSKRMAKFAIEMDIKDTHSSEMREYEYFNYIHRRCDGFKTLRLLIYCVMMHKCMCLATMDIEREAQSAQLGFGNNLMKLPIE